MRWGASIPSHWPGLDRLAPANLVADALGSVRGSLEPLFLSVVVLWLLVAVWQHLKVLSTTIDVELLVTAVLFFSFALLLPDQVDRTYAFASRWMPIGLTCLVLGLPTPDLSRRLLTALALTMLAVFSWTTTRTWQEFESEELAGLHEALEALPDEPRLLGLDFVRDSPRIRYPAYLQMHAYGQLLHGGRLNFSFVSLGSSLVVCKDFDVADPWTSGLEWRPGFLQPDDLNHFDHVLLHAPSEIEQELRIRIHRMVPLTRDGRWRLYRVLPTSRPMANSSPA